MPEYLAPGVYVEETSFRSKSIEGVGTSTTGFIGPTRKGPINGTPGLITSFGDFERIYGGLANLSFSMNYVAHAVRAYFNEGGARLYVCRVYVKDGSNEGKAQSRDLVGAGSSDDKARAFFAAHSAGEIGNGVIRLREVAIPVTRRVIERAPEGTLLGIGGKDPATPASLTGSTPPFSLTPEGAVAATSSLNCSNLAQSAVICDPSILTKYTKALRI